jgi:hypothetical protein
MTKSSNIGSVLRCMLVNGPGGVNLAAPAESLHRSRPLRRSSLWRDSLSNRDDRAVVADWEGLNLQGLISARTLNGAKAWRIDRLYLPQRPNAPGGAVSAGLGLLEAVARAAGQRGGERVFLRVASGGTAAPIAQRTGYFPSYQEVHLRGLLPPDAADHTADAHQLRPLPPDAADHTADAHQLRPLSPSDEFALFQLYCSATPQPVRAAAGVTFDQWRDARELQGRRRNEWAAWDGSRIAGWLGVESYGQANSLRLLHHPAHPEVVDSLLAKAASLPGEHSWLVRDYQQPIETMLLRSGLKEAGNYTVHIKTVVAPVVSHEFSLVEA